MKEYPSKRPSGPLSPWVLIHLLPWLAPAATAAVLNLTNDTIAGIPQTTTTVGATVFVGGQLEGAWFRRTTDGDESNAGSGQFRDLYRVQGLPNSGPEEGYNRDGVMDATAPANGFDPVLTVGQLVEDSTGTGYVFVVDTTEPVAGTQRYISLDEFNVYLGASIPPDPLPQTLAELGAELGVPIYEMNPTGADNHVLLDSSLFAGSGEMDLFIFVPIEFFGDAADDQQVYIYTEFGSYTGAPGFDPSSGQEQVSIPGAAISEPVDPLVPAVPEPGVAGLLLSCGCFSLRRRR